jgi:hypothetical protein
MSDREESVSTRDLASTPTEDARRTTDEREGTVATVDEPAAESTHAAGGHGDVTPEAPVQEGRREEPVQEGRRDAADEGDAEDAALLPPDQGTDFQARWESIQTTFVDDPRDAVENADALVAELMQRLADGFARERERLEGQWSRGEDVSTEDLRIALQRYRSFFRRLLSA